MVVLSLLMKGLDKIDQQRDEAIDKLIQRTTYHGLDGKTAQPGKPSWATVYESLRRNENDRQAQARQASWQHSHENQRCAEDQKSKGLGTHSHLRGPVHRKT